MSATATIEKRLSTLEGRYPSSLQQRLAALEERPQGGQLTANNLVINAKGEAQHLAAPQRINIAEAGAKPGTDGSAAVLDAIADYGAEGIRNFCLYIPTASEAYLLALGVFGEEVLRKGVCITLEGDGQLASWIAPAKPEEPILTVIGPADGTNQGLTIRDLGIELVADRRYDEPLFQVNFARNFHYERVAYRSANEANYTGAIFSHESSYEAEIELNAVEGSHYILPFKHTNEKIPVGQTELQVCDTFRITGTYTVMGPIFHNAGNQLHSICPGAGFKGEQSTYYNPATIYTTLAKEGKAGETKIEPVSAAGLKVGDFLMVGHEALGQTGDYVKVSAVEGNVLTLAPTTPLLHNHAAGAEITQGGAALVLGDNVISATINTPHLEHYLGAITLGNTQNVTLISPYSTSAYVMRRCGNDGHNTIISGELTGSTVANALQSVAADNPATGLGETFVFGEFSEQGTATHAMELIPSSATSYTCVFKGPKGGWTIRRNVASAGEIGKDIAYEVTRGNATTIKLQYAGRGYFKDGIAGGDLGNITGKTSGEIDALFAVSPGDSTSTGTIIATAEREGHQVILTRKTGAGNKWQVTNALTQIE